MQWKDLEIIKPLGEGQAGTVWLANNYDKRTSKEFPLVAIKRYKKWLTEEPSQLERHLKEVHIGRKISHNNLVKTIELIYDNEYRPVLVMKYYDGLDLESYLADNDYNLPLDKSLRLLKELSGAINALHSEGIIHRDIKPANILVLSDKAVLMDLGVVYSPDFPEATQTDTFLGTIRYASPEFLFKEISNIKSDIFSFGLIAIELFYKEKYLRQLSHWAELVVEKSNWYWRKNDDLSQSNMRVRDIKAIDSKGNKIKIKMNRSTRSFFEELEKKNGINIADFAYQILSKSLCDERDRFNSLKGVVDAFENEIWKDYFYFDKDRFIQGKPSNEILNRFSLNEIKELNLNLFYESICRKLSHGELDFLKAMAKEYYWSLGDFDPILGVVSYDGMFRKHEYVDKFIDLNLLKFNKSKAFRIYNKEKFTDYMLLSDSTKLLYRYGYLS